MASILRCKVQKATLVGSDNFSEGKIIMSTKYFESIRQTMQLGVSVMPRRAVQVLELNFKSNPSPST
jgi:hypothetical protein